MLGLMSDVVVYLAHEAGPPSAVEDKPPGTAPIGGKLERVEFTAQALSYLLAATAPA